jgi:glyoxylase-like metal-dependent hydrolase (beta-lactamase superfamily II)
LFYHAPCRATSRALAVRGIFITVLHVQLEDHLGDIIRKACAMNSISKTVAAAAAEISESEFLAFGETGKSAQKINLPALAKLLGLNSTKLEATANGWLPAKTDLSRWQKLRVITTKDDDFSVNCFLVWDEATRAAALFDTGLDATPILDCLTENNLTLKHIFITHSHWDHVEALPQIRASWPAAQIHSGSKSAPASQRNQPGARIPLGGLRVTHRETPGHADDGVTYLISHWPDAAPQVAIVGDTILAGSICNGNGAWELAKQKIREEILSLPMETLLCPGHGPLTTVAEEKEHNLFF